MKHFFKQVSIIFLLCLIVSPVLSDVQKTVKIEGTGLGSNDLGEIAWDGQSLWVTGSGTLTNLIGSGHLKQDWISYENLPGFGKGSMSALYASGDTLVVAWQYSGDISGLPYDFGDGLSISKDHGQTWEHIPVTYYFPERIDWKNPSVQTMTWDIVYSGKTMWCSTTYGYLIKTDDLGKTWGHVYPNADSLDYGSLNHHGVCVDAYGDTLWVGTMQGINVSFDKGESWKNFSWPLDHSGDPETDNWPGNFVTAVEHNVVGGKTHIWIGSQYESQNYGLGIDGICYTNDNGQTWEYKTKDYIAHNFAFGFNGASDPDVSAETVLAATDSGLVISYDFGEKWNLFNIRELQINGTESNPDTTVVNSWEYGTQIYGLVVVKETETIWVTSSNGLARSLDWGKSWEIFQGVTRVKSLDTGDRNIGISANFDEVETYAFPNPFSPLRSDRNYSRTKIQYSIQSDASITICIYDYQGRLIKELIRNEHRQGGRDHQEVWDGRDSENNIVPNGVYFYVIKTDKGDSARDKIVVLD
ncbi:MAG: T9SS type A sorting domain-containing protein [Candidatus Latescibacteria bacterium]|nr:T9SS type A sorting domain-containing protein [Candidatus Latescibacterota bacterium]